jgi:hypothetical protein
MSNTENTSAIDEKKNGETENTSPDFKGFIKNYLSSIVFTIGISIFIIGGLGLYTTKIAQSNILPDNIELAPYTIKDRVVKDIEININIMKPLFFSKNDNISLQKSTFNSQEYLDSFNKNLLCHLKKSADPNSGLLGNTSLFFSIVYDNLVAKNFLAINTIFYYLSHLPESAIMLLYGIFGIFIWVALYFFNVCISIFYHIVNIPQLFRDIDDTTNKWESVDNINFFHFTKMLLFLFMWIPIGILAVFITPIFFTIYGLIAPLFAKYKIKNTNNNIDYNVLDFLQNTFVYKKFFLFILITLSLFSNGIKYLGNKSIIGILVAVIFAYFMKLYSNPQPEDNGFIIVKTLNEIIQANVSSSNKNLVEICKSIPMNDTKMDKIRNEGTFRIPKTRKHEDIEPTSLKGGSKVFKKGIKHVKKYDIRWT